MSPEQITATLNFSNYHFTIMNQFLVQLYYNLEHFETSEEIEDEIDMFFTNMKSYSIKGLA